MNLKKFDSDALEKPDDTIDAVKRTSHKHGFIYFFLDSDHDYKLSRQELSSFLDCSVFGDNKNATLTMLMSRDFNGDGLDVNGKIGSIFERQRALYTTTHMVIQKIYMYVHQRFVMFFFLVYLLFFIYFQSNYINCELVIRH